MFVLKQFKSNHFILFKFISNSVQSAFLLNVSKIREKKKKKKKGKKNAQNIAAICKILFTNKKKKKKKKQILQAHDYRFQKQ